MKLKNYKEVFIKKNFTYGIRSLNKDGVDLKMVIKGENYEI